MNKKHSNTSFLYLTTILSSLLILAGCKKDPVLPTILTSSISEITVSSAVTGGNITSDGGAEITTRGVAWGISSKPVITGSHTSDNKGPGAFTSSLTGLTPNTLYYVRAFATNEAGTAYGNEVTFNTNPILAAVITTADVTGITTNSAVSGGNITSDGGGAVSSRGICWSAIANPTTSDNKTSNGSGTGTFSANITSLTPGSTYHVRAYAINSAGTSYGNDVTFSALPVTPTLSTAIISQVTRTTAASGGNITANGGAQVTARGVCWGTASNPVISGPHSSDGTGSGVFTSSLTGLLPGTHYYFRAYATNVVGTSYGNELTFTTNPAEIPSVSTGIVSSVSLNTAVSGGDVTSDNGGQVTERGVCWNTSGNPTTASSKTTDGTGTGSFSSNLTGLTPGNIYYVRAYATNSAGTSYGSQIRFSTSITDITGNIYRTVVIGNQMWMQSDLKTTRLNDDTSIPNITENDPWRLQRTPAYCWYENSPAYGDMGYGILYNWYTVETGKLCPSGWHTPSDSDFGTLELYLGVPADSIGIWGWRGTDEGSEMKSETGWNGTNSSGFSALPGGYRYGLTGVFQGLGTITYWWTSDENDADRGWYRQLSDVNGGIYRASTSKWGGKFVRCVKD